MHMHARSLVFDASISTIVVPCGMCTKSVVFHCYVQNNLPLFKTMKGCHNNVTFHTPQNMIDGTTHSFLYIL